MIAPGLEFALEALVVLAAPIEAGVGHGTGRRIIPITGGVVSGPRLNGVVVPGGADWRSCGRTG